MPTKQATSPPRLEAPTVPPSNGHAAPDAPEWPGLDVDLDRFRRDLGPMCERVAGWAAARPDRVKAVYADAAQATVTFYVVRRQAQYDSDLLQQWMKFDRTLVRDFESIQVEVRQVAEPALETFVNLRRARQIYGDA